MDDIGFYKLQKRVALRNCGVIDPENIDEYIAFDGYKALAKALTEMTPEAGHRHEVLARPGCAAVAAADSPRVMKWAVWLPQPRRNTEIRRLQCRRGRPRARSWTAPCWRATRTPILEAMAIGGYAIGASDQGYIYVRAEYPIAVKRLQIAIDQAREYGLLGEDIFGTGFQL